MPNPFSDLGVSDADVQRAIGESADVDAELNRFMNDDVVGYARSIAPVDEGAYAAGIKVTQRARRGKGKVAATDYKSHWIEDGTGGETPTAEHAVMARTAARYAGTLDSR